MNSPRMPRPSRSPVVSPSPIAVLRMSLERFLADEAEIRAEYPWADRFVMGMPLAPWQRALKWDEGLSRRFIVSAWTGIPLGIYAVTGIDLEKGDQVRYCRLSNCVVDGQQRLHALELYFMNELAVPDAAGVMTLWSELDIVEQRWFERRIFERGLVPMSDERELREFYDLMNFGGVPHEEHERAAVHCDRFTSGGEEGCEAEPMRPTAG